MVNNEENVCVWQQELKCLVLIDLMTNLLSDDIYIEVPCNCVYIYYFNNETSHSDSCRQSRLFPPLVQMQLTLTLFRSLQFATVCLI